MTTKPSKRTARFKLFSALANWWPFGLYSVSGISMQPALHDGDVAVGWKVSSRPKLKPGSIVVVRTPERPIIKRIKRLEGDQVWLHGDNAEASTDSRQLGSFLLSDVEARVIMKF